MDKEYFIRGLIEKRKNCIEAVVENLEYPPGRSPHPKDLKLAEFWANCNENDKNIIKQIISEASDMSFFSILTLLDHVSFIEGVGEKTKFELYAVKNGEKVLLNSPEAEELHDIYNSFVLDKA